MKYLQTFRDKIRDLEKYKFNLEKLDSELYKDANELITLIVDILDEMTPNNTEKSFNVNIKSDSLKIYKITNNKTNLNSDRDIKLHSSGLGVIIYCKVGNGLTNHLLWNFMSGGNKDYKTIIDILDGLIKKYNKEYKDVILKKYSAKYNL
jgi:hypothetical protein